MESPAQRIFEADSRSAHFRNGVQKGFWDLATGDAVPGDLSWPNIIFWLHAPPRDKAPDRFYVRVDLTGYRTCSPTGTFWDPEKKSTLEFGKRPKGRSNSRVAKVFRTDWEDGRAFYHPYDRMASASHPNWKSEQPHLVWDADHTIVDYLEEFYALLQSGDYIGV